VKTSNLKDGKNWGKTKDPPVVEKRSEEVKKKDFSEKR
jgi:hypothetical protein